MKLSKLYFLIISILLTALSCRNNDDENLLSRDVESTFLKSSDKDGIESSEQYTTNPQIDTIRSGGYRIATDSTSSSKKNK